MPRIRQSAPNQMDGDDSTRKWLFHTHRHGCGDGDNNNEDHHTRDHRDDARGNDNARYVRGDGVRDRGRGGVQKLKSSEVQGLLRRRTLPFESM